MKNSKKSKSLMKKAIAGILGITMAFGSLALPEKGYRKVCRQFRLILLNTKAVNFHITS